MIVQKFFFVSLHNIDKDHNHIKTTKTMRKTLVLMIIMSFAALHAMAANDFSYSVQGGQLKVSFITPDIVRVQYSPDGEFRSNNTGVCVPHTQSDIPLQVSEGNGYRSIVSDSLEVRVSPVGAVMFYDRNGRLLLAEDTSCPHSAEKQWIEKVTYGEDSREVIHTANGDVQKMKEVRRDTIGYTWRCRLNLQWQQDEALYGLGSHMEDYMNLRGKRLYLCQHNLKAMVPVINSTAGYGLLVDAGCAMQFYDDTEHGIMLDAASEIDYYFMKGATMDKIVERYRWLTGEAPMMPRYLFGYTQSKERYVSSDDLLKTLKTFRERHIPVDMIVQDWNYWPGGQWGTMTMVPEYYPDKRALTDSIHSMHARLMISIWPNAMNSPQWEDFRDRGLLFPGTTVYDAFKKEARDLYWQYANREFFSNGFDAWWCDSSEPIDADWNSFPKGYDPTNQKWRWQLSTDALSAALGAERSQLFSLYHAQGIYENQRLATDKKRVVNLTRSSYAGQQRYSTITWNGDTYASWKSFAQMIPAGLNFMATGCPYWSIDVGAFFTNSSTWQWFHKGEYPDGCKDPEYRELYCRMLQYATFLPVMRSHGTETPREPWQFGNPGEPFYESILSSIRLRYSLLPYIYSLAARVTHDGYTMTRALAFDFPRDIQVLDIKDEFLFGPSFLVAPMTKKGTSRSVYLPAGSGWTDYHTGVHYVGGQHVTADAPINRIPLFVRDGSIVPLGADVEYADQDPDARTLLVYPGNDASFTLYEDEGDNYNCEQGASSSIPMMWNDSKRMLTIGNRTGSFPGMTVSRTFTVRLADGKIKTVKYNGKAKKVKF